MAAIESQQAVSTNFADCFFSNQLLYLYLPSTNKLKTIDEKHNQPVDHRGVSLPLKIY